jgi:hypothetical protein
LCIIAPINRNEPSAGSRNQNSEYLPQRRKGRKEIKLPDLAFLASWREQIPVLDSHGPPENLRKARKFLSIAMHSNAENAKKDSL